MVSPSRCRWTSSISIVAIEAAPQSLRPIGRGRRGAEDAGALALLVYHALCWSSRHDVVAGGGRWNMGSSGSVAWHHLLIPWGSSLYQDIISLN